MQLLNIYDFISFVFLQLKNLHQLDGQKYCAVPICNNSIVYSGSDKPNSNDEIVFHKFPSDTVMLEKWLNFCNIYKSISHEHQNAQICSEHFNKDNYENKYTDEVKYFMIWYQFLILNVTS